MGLRPAQDPTEVGKRLAEIRGELDKMGVESADIAFDHGGVLGLTPVVKSVRVASPSIANVAKADPGNIQEVAASQLALSNEYYANVLAQARRSFGAAIVAGSIGLGFFLAAIAFILSHQNTNAALITTLRGAIVEVIAGLNFWLFGRTAKQLDAFHVRLEQTQRFLLANSVCHYLGESVQDAARSDLVKLIASVTPGTVS